MNGLILLAQAFFDHQARTQAENLRAAGLRAAEKGRRMALAGVFFALGGAILFSALLIALIDLGLQIDRDNGIGFSGLMISSTILLIMALLAFGTGGLIGRDPKIEAAAETPPAQPQSELRPLLEAVAVTLLKEFLESHKSKPQTSNEPRSQSEPSDDV